MLVCDASTWEVKCVVQDLFVAFAMPLAFALSWAFARAFDGSFLRALFGAFLGAFLGAFIGEFSSLCFCPGCGVAVGRKT